MITDEIMDVINRMIDLTTGTAYAEGIMMVQDVLAEYDEDRWNDMSTTERDVWLSGKITKQITL